jgi:ribonuclease R
MCRIRDIKDDYYTFDSEQYALVGEQKKLLQLGDFMLKLKNADLVKNS